MKYIEIDNYYRYIVGAIVMKHYERRLAMRITKKIVFRRMVLKREVPSCGPCGDGVGYSVPGPIGCGA